MWRSLSVRKSIILCTRFIFVSGAHLRDVIYFEEGNNKKGTDSIISLFSRLQQAKYPFEDSIFSPMYTFLENLTAKITDISELFKLSKAREPK